MKFTTRTLYRDKGKILVGLRATKIEKCKAKGQLLTITYKKTKATMTIPLEKLDHYIMKKYWHDEDNVKAPVLAFYYEWIPNKIFKKEVEI
jgi:hypothetical protein